MDLIQVAAEQALLQLFPDVGARCPTEFDGMWARVVDTLGIQYKITFQISEINSLWELELTEENLKKHEYLICYRPQNNLHCVHVMKYSEQNKLLYCVNSWNGKDDWPIVPLGDAKMLFKVTFTCVEEIQ